MYDGELRCAEGKLFGVMVGGVLEVRCQSQFCRTQSGVVVIHRFNLMTGERLEDKRYRNPPRAREEVDNAHT